MSSSDPRPKRPGKNASRWDLHNYAIALEKWEERNPGQRNNWSEPVGGSDSEGNSLTVSFGSGPSKGHTLLGDGDRSEGNFLDSSRHDHYGSGNGPNANGTRRGQYNGSGN